MAGDATRAPLTEITAARMTMTFMTLPSLAVADHMPVRSLKIAAARHIVGIFLFQLHLAEQEEIDIIAGQHLVGRPGELLAGGSRRHQMRSDDDDKVAVVLLERF